MKEKGKVIEVKENKAIVLMEKNERCEKCGICNKLIERQPFIEAENEINAKEGDSVIVEIDEDLFLKICLFIYGMPLIGLITGVVFSSFLKDLFLKVFFFIFFLGLFWYTGIKLGEKYGKNKKPKIISYA